MTLLRYNLCCCKLYFLFRCFVCISLFHCRFSLLSLLAPKGQPMSLPTATSSAARRTAVLARHMSVVPEFMQGGWALQRIPKVCVCVFVLCVCVFVCLCLCCVFVLCVCVFVCLCCVFVLCVCAVCLCCVFVLCVVCCVLCVCLCCVFVCLSLSLSLSL